MKKRLLALALCLALAVSLLPVTALAFGGEMLIGNVEITAGEVVYTEGYGYKVSVLDCKIYQGGIGDKVLPDSEYTCSGTLYSDSSFNNILKTAPVCGSSYYAKFLIRSTWWLGFPQGCELIPPSGYAAEFIRAVHNPHEIQIEFKLSNIDHDWQLTQTENTLTVTCKNCNTPPVSVTLKADSVTLPDSPFNARLEGWEQLVSEFPNAKRKFEYKYRGPGDSEYHIVEPTAANAKAGEYQVGVYLWDITRGPIDPSEGTYLYVKYTAADPAITAQTGDNRPIELMMAGVAVFSALAAAAFILDSKRRYHR